MERYEEPSNKMLFLFILVTIIFAYVSRDKIFKSFSHAFGYNYAVAYDYDSTVYTTVADVEPTDVKPKVEIVKAKPDTIKRATTTHQQTNLPTETKQTKQDLVSEDVPVIKDVIKDEDKELLLLEEEPETIVDTNNVEVEAVAVEKKKKFRLFKKKTI